MKLTLYWSNKIVLGNSHLQLFITFSVHLIQEMLHLQCVVFKAVIKANAGCIFQPVWVATLDQVFLVTHQVYVGTEVFCGQENRNHSASQDGQCNYNFLHQQNGGHILRRPLQPGSGIMEVVLTQEDSSTCRAPPGQGEY